jgi:hypothetical protein
LNITTKNTCNLYLLQSVMMKKILTVFTMFYSMTVSAQIKMMEIQTITKTDTIIYRQFCLKFNDSLSFLITGSGKINEPFSFDIPNVIHKDYSKSNKESYTIERNSDSLSFFLKEAINDSLDFILIDNKVIYYEGATISILYLNDNCLADSIVTLSILNDGSTKLFSKSSFVYNKIKNKMYCIETHNHHLGIDDFKREISWYYEFSKKKKFSCELNLLFWPIYMSCPNQLKTEIIRNSISK